MRFSLLLLILACLTPALLQGCSDNNTNNTNNAPPPVEDASPDALDQSEDRSEDAPDAPDDSPDLPAQKAAIGEGCASPEDCASGHCPSTPFGGICSECTVDADCTWGCNPPTLMGVGDVGPGLCNEGQLGARCQDASACQGDLLCGRNPLTLPIGNDDRLTCNGCAEDADCAPSERCSIVRQGEGTTLAFDCVDAQSVPDGELCDWEGSGDEACQNLCGVAEVSGPVELKIGVCSQCRSDDDCQAPATCQVATIDLQNAQTPIPGRCQ